MYVLVLRYAFSSNYILMITIHTIRQQGPANLSLKTALFILAFEHTNEQMII